MPPPSLTPDLADEYDRLFARAMIRPEHQFEIDAVVTRISEPHNLAQYQQVETLIGVPAHVVGIVHPQSRSQSALHELLSTQR